MFEDVLHLLDGHREVVVGVERAAVDLGPAVLPGQPVARRLVALLARERVADALHALVVVRGRGAARLDADRAALRLDLLHALGEVDADVVVVRADVGDAQRLVLVQQVAVPGQDRDAGLLRLLQAPRHRGGVRGADGDAVDLLGDQVVDDLHLLLAAAVLAGADILALELARELLLGLLAAVAGLVEERVVHVLRHERERVLLGARRRAAEPERQDRDRRSSHQ